jgi:hypothetical protein
VIGLLNTGSPDAYARHVIAFREGLRETGYIQGDNITLEFPGRRTNSIQVAVIATSGGNTSAIAAKLQRPIWLAGLRGLKLANVILGKSLKCWANPP